MAIDTVYTNGAYMNLQQLEYIVAVDQLRSFSKAATLCNVTQATLSSMVKKLESELELVIFDRKAKPVLTTDCGREIVHEAKKVLLHVNELQDLARTVKAHIIGEVNLGIIPTIASALLPRILSPLMKAYPELHLNITEQTTETIISNLKTGKLDMGIIATPWPDASLEEMILYYEALWVYGGKENGQTYLTPEDIQHEQVWLFEEGHCLRDQFINLCSLTPRESALGQFRFQANSFDTLLNMVDSYGGLTLLPELYCETLSEERRKKIRHFSSPIPVREVSLVFYRPFARHRLNQAIGDSIKGILEGELSTANYPASELVIAKV